jgi:hypothetical protein
VAGGEHEPGRAGGAEPDVEDDAPGVVDVEPDRERAGDAQNLNGAQKKDCTLDGRGRRSSESR